MEKLLLRLLRKELWASEEIPKVLSQKEYAELMALAESQTVAGLAGAALMEGGCQLEKHDAVDLYTKMEAIRKGNERLNDELCSFVRALERRNIQYIIIKGQTLGALYPHPKTRMSGDVDMYFVGENYEKVKAFVESKLHLNLEKMADGKHVEFEHCGCVFELHNMLSKFAYKKHQRYFDEMIDKAIVEEPYTVSLERESLKAEYEATGAERCKQNISTLSPTYNVLYTFLHLFYHLIASGVGLRQFCDLAVLIATPATLQIDTDLLRKHLEKLELYRAFCAVGAFLVDELGLAEEVFPFQLSVKDRKWVSVIRRNVMRSGNFGRAKRSVKQAGLIHSVETGWLTMQQQWIFFRLAPKEVLWRFPRLFEWFWYRIKVQGGRELKGD